MRKPAKQGDGGWEKTFAPTSEQNCNVQSSTSTHVNHIADMDKRLHENEEFEKPVFGQTKNIKLP